MVCRRRNWAGAALVALGCVCGCGPTTPTNTYFDEQISPIFQANCVQQTTGCHLADSHGIAAGNLDLSSYDALMRRRDVLRGYGPYPVGLLLLKATDPLEIDVETLDAPDPARPDDHTVLVRTDIRHAAGANIRLDSSAALTIRHWIESGFARNGAPAERHFTPSEECAHGIDPDEARFDPTSAPSNEASYRRFVETVQPVLRERCASTSCHGNLLRVLFLSCGETEEELRWNYFISTWHLNIPAGQSELLLRPLATAQGGALHQGGDVFETTGDPGYRAIASWAEDLVASDPDSLRESGYYATPGFRFFVDRVQPTLVRKGCLLASCHSSFTQAARFLGGSAGSFSRITQHRNHGIGLDNLATESEDPNQSRVIAKNLFNPDQIAGGQGMAHRGGSLLEDFGPDNRPTPDDCAGYDADNGDLNEIPAYCILVRWQQIERTESIRWERVDPEPLHGVVWVARPPGLGEAMDFDTYRPGADLRRADATLAADGSITMGPSSSLLAGCGLSPATADVRGPAVSWDGLRIAFSARSSADEPSRLYWVDEGGTGCERVPGIEPAVPVQNGILTHDFDPAFSPDGQLVFASTRGNLDPGVTDYSGPTRTPAAMQPNANLYVYERFQTPPVRQLTFMLNQELMPTFTSAGFITYTVEKREPGFHQISLRGQNIDGGLFLPAFAARDSMGFASATEVVQLPNLNFAFVAAPLHAPDGAGTIGIVNQSLGAFRAQGNPGNPLDIPSMRVPSVRSAVATPGMYRSPVVLPGRLMLVSCALGATPESAPYDFDLCTLDPLTGQALVVAGEPGVAEVEAVAIYRHENRGITESDGRGQLSPHLETGARDAVVTMHDVPMQMSLMFTNTRTGRPIDFRMSGLDVLEPLPPPPGAETFADVAGQTTTDDFGQLFVSRRLLGHVPLQDDFSAAFRVPGGLPLLYRPTDDSGRPLVFAADSEFGGIPMSPREEDQYYPGERSRRGIVRPLFNAVCGFCHGSMTGREVDATINPDSLTGASRSLAHEHDPTDLVIPPAQRGRVEGP